MGQLIDGMGRLKRPNQGIDVAGAKSLTRRLIADVRALELEASKVNHTLSHIIERLRDIHVQHESLVRHEDKDDGPNVHDEVKSKIDLYQRQRELLKRKIAKLQGHLLTRRRLLEEEGDLDVGFRLGLAAHSDQEEALT